MSSTVLSTKILTLAQKELLLNAGLGLVEYNALTIMNMDFEIENGFDHYIFTSQNAVSAYLKKHAGSKSGQKTVLCVGEKTQSLLQQNGLKVVEMAQNSSELAEIIAKNYKNDSFLFFSGNLRRDDIPHTLKENKIRFKEIVAYQTLKNPKTFDATFDGILFFSPSGVESYMAANTLKDSPVFCIGETTAFTAKKHTEKIIIANKPTIENVLVQAVKYLKNRC